MPNTSISFPASPTVNQQYTYGSTTYVYTGINWAVYVSSASLPPFVTSANIVDGTIVNADINASAAIAGSKISPVFTNPSTFSSTLGVTGATILSNTLNVGAATQLGTTLLVVGAATLSSTLGVTGNLAVNTNKFTVDASSGDTLAAGTLTAIGGVVATSLTSKIQPITASIGSNALTITLNPTILDFRSSTLTSGTVTTVVVPAAISLTIPAGATIGTVNNVQSRIVVLAINNAGTVELAAVNIAGSSNGTKLDETTLITTVTNASGGNSATAYYSTTARSNVAYRVVGYIESTQTTAGTWASAPTTIQGMGGQALTAMSSLGYGQIWQTVTRVNGTTYYNTTGKPIVACFQAILLPSAGMSFTINSQTGIATITNAQVSNQTISTSAIIPVNASYINVVSGSTSANVFYELR